MYLKATIRPDLRPEDPDVHDKKQLPDENAWVHDQFTRLVDSLIVAI